MSFKEKRIKKNKKEVTRKKVKSENSSSEDEGSEHELFYYANDRVQLMKEVIKTLKSKKIKALAPVEIKNMDIEEINTMLLEELLGISSKRLKKIFDGQTPDDVSSSSSDEERGKPIDIISLDDISDDDDLSCIFVESPSVKNKKDPKNDKSKNSKKHKIKKENKGKVVKEEQQQHTTNTKPAEKVVPENEKLLSVLELLELQARARAIRSQLAIEAENKSKTAESAATTKISDDDDDDAIIIQTPKTNEIVISSSDSETEKVNSNTLEKDENDKSKKIQKIKINRSRINADYLTSDESDDNEDIAKNNNENVSCSKEIVSDIPLPRQINNTVNSLNIDTLQTVSNEHENISSSDNQNKFIEERIVEESIDEQNTNKNHVDNNTDKSDDDNVIHCDIVEIEDFD